MTAPAVAPAPVAQAPVVAPVTPVPAPSPAAPEAPVSMQSIVERISKKVTPEAVEQVAVEVKPNAATPALSPESAPPPIDASASPAEQVGQSLESQDAPTNLVNELRADEPEGEILLRAREDDGRFTQMDKTRKYELVIKDKQTGETKVYEKNLDGLMRLAKDGITMQKSRAELDQHRKHAPTIIKENNTLKSKISQLETLTHQLLTADEPWVVQQRESYAQQFTPEARVKQLEEQLAQVRQQPVQQQPRTPQMPPQMARQIQEFGAAVAPVTQEVESLVGVDAARGRLIGALAPIMVNNQIPPERLADVQQYIMGPYREWARAEAAKQQTAQQELEAARQERARAQQAARSVGTATRPAGGSASTAPAPQTKPRSTQEAIDRIIRRPVAAG